MSVDFLAHFESLLDCLPRLVAMAEELPSPNAEDDLCSRLAIVGFSYHCPTEHWGCDHLRFLRERQEAGFPMVEDINRGALFCCLCIGYLLGLFEARAIDEKEFETGETQLAGFLAMSRQRLAQALDR